MGRARVVYMIFGAPKVVTPPVLIKDSIGWTIPYLASWMIEWIVFGPPTDYPVRFLRERRH
jgi:hypothetical protein